MTQPELFRRCLLEKRTGDGAVLLRQATMTEADAELRGPLRIADRFGMCGRGWRIIGVFPGQTTGDDVCANAAPIIAAAPLS